jgi:hypothetical protein
VVSRCALAGGTSTTLAHDQQNPGAIALDDEDVFWIADAVGGAGSAVNAVSKGGGAAPRVVATGPSPATALAADGTHIYVGVSKLIQSAPVTGGPLVTLVPTPADPFDFTLVGGVLYWATSAGVYGARVP